MPTDRTSDGAGDEDGRDRRGEGGRDGTESARPRDDPEPDRRPRPPGSDRGSGPRPDGSAQERRRYEPVGRARREVPHGSDRSRRMQDVDRSAPERDAWSVLDGDLRGSDDEPSRDSDGTNTGEGDGDGEVVENDGDGGDEGRGEQSTGDEPAADERPESDAGEDDERDPPGRRLYRPVGEDPDAARARFRRRAGRGRGPGYPAERDDREPVSRSQLRARPLDDGGRTGSDPNARSRYPTRDGPSFDDGRGTTSRSEGEHGRTDPRSDRRTDRRSDRHAHPWADTGPSGGEGFVEEGPDGERSDGGRYDRWRLLHELESRSGSAGRDERHERSRPRRPPY